MAEYIEREVLLKAMSYHNYYPKGKHFLKGIETAEEIIEHFPAEDVQPVKHGKWIAHSRTDLGELQNNTIECSECGIHFPLLNMPRRSFCPNCGARMDGET